MSVQVFWFLPTHGDSRYLGTAEGARAVDLPYLRWHFHTVCVAANGTVTPTDTSTCAADTTLRTSGYMAHVWFVQDADLRYAFAMTPPMAQLRAAGALG